MQLRNKRQDRAKFELQIDPGPVEYAKKELVKWQESRKQMYAHNRLGESTFQEQTNCRETCHRSTMACKCRGAGSSKAIFRQPRSIVAVAAEQRPLRLLQEGRMCSVAVVAVGGGGCDDDGVGGGGGAGCACCPLCSWRGAAGSFQRHFWFR